ncbi:MAG: type II secretion system secretin GspD [Pelovirga sp.]
MLKNGIFPGILLFVFLMAGFLFAPVVTVARELPDDLLITLDFQNVELTDMISTISELTGKNFLYDEAVRGKVTILSPEPVTLAEAYSLFTTVLRVKGFTVIPAGQVNKIVSLATAKEETLPIGGARAPGDQLVTRVLKMKNLDALVAVDTILRPLMPKTSHAVAHQATNTVVITDTAANIDRLSRLLDTLDRTWDNERMEMVVLQYAEAQDTANTVMQMLEGDSSSGTPARSAARQAQTSSGKRVSGQIIPYGRTNTLMLQGEDAFIEQAKKLIVHLDTRAEVGRSGVYVYYLENAEAEPLAETLNQIISGTTATAVPRPEGTAPEKMFEDVSVTFDRPTNAVIINASLEEYENVVSLIRQLDIRRKQVFVEALIMELGMDAVLALGTSLQGAVDLGDDSVISVGSGMPLGGPGIGVLTQAVEGILMGGLFSPITTTIDGESVTVPALSALINLSKTDSDVNVLSAPRLLTSDNEEAEILVGENVPIITSRTESTGSGNPISTVERQDAALILRFTPQITEGGLVRMKIHQEISGVKSTGGVGNVDEIGPTLTKTLLRNSIVARDGETVVLGGLFKNTVTKQQSKVPLLGDIPVLGWLFKSTRDEERKTSLLIFITPRVINSSEDLNRVTRDSQLDLQMFRTEGGSERFFEKQESQRIEDAETTPGG